MCLIRVTDFAMKKGGKRWRWLGGVQGVRGYPQSREPQPSAELGTFGMTTKADVLQI